MRYKTWLAIFHNHLLELDMPLLTPANPEKFLIQCHRKGFTAQRVAEMFNRRFVIAMDNKVEGENR